MPRANFPPSRIHRVAYFPSLTFGSWAMGAVWRLPATPCLGVIVKKSVCPLFPAFSPLRQGKRRTRREGEARFTSLGRPLQYISTTDGFVRSP
jgi:hypothetical protein